MTTGEFADKVSAMREAQKEYFKYRTKEALQRSKQLEKEVDDILGNRKKRIENTVQQGTLIS
jgi:hypothetical protein